jgi:radical SAM-linked protein
MTPGEYRLRVAYGKTNRLRHLSHLEVVRALERSIRRANLPFAVTQGFNPHMKAAFGPALPVGTAGEHEYLDVWLTRYTEADTVLEALAKASPGDLAPQEVRYVADRSPSLTAALTIGVYRIEIDGEGIDPQKVYTELTHQIGEGEFTTTHRGKTKVFDLTHSLPKEPGVSVSDGGIEIELTVRMGPQGSLRPEVFVRAVLDRSEVAASAVRTTRLDTFIEGDEGVWSRPV